jgi:cell wall-associated NlpC family hydrolase
MRAMPLRPIASLRLVASLLAAGVVAVLLAACGTSGTDGGVPAASASPAAATTPGATTPGATTAPATPATPATDGSATVTTKSGTPVPRDAEEAQSFALPERQAGDKEAPAPGKVRPASDPAGGSGASPSDGVSPGAPTDADIKRELEAMDKAVAEQEKAAKSGGRLSLERDGTAVAPPGAPAVIQRIVSGANAIAHFPYVYGGGHGTFVDSAYDCSGSLSYAFAAGGILRRTMTSGELAGWGDPGQGKWITIFANETHTFMYVGGLRYDTSGRSGPLGSRWQTAPRSLAGFTVRHPKGL